ncbi:MAG TPA: SpoIIE family protein phosphatase [Actinocrinis sp.]
MSAARMPEPPEDGDRPHPAGEARAVSRTFEAQPVVVVGLAGPPEFRIVTANAAARSVAGRQDLVGLPLREAFAAGDELLWSAHQAYSTRATVQQDLRMRDERAGGGGAGERAVGGTICILDPVFAPDGTVDGVVAAWFRAPAPVRGHRAGDELDGSGPSNVEDCDGLTHALQRELLPAGVPVLPGLRIAASYLLAGSDSAAGGDWYDAVPLPDGRVALIVGDVVGNGPAASAAMGRLQTVLHERLAAGADVLDAVKATDTAARTIRGARAATACVMVIDPATGALTYCTAGHPPPLLLRGKTPCYLTGTDSGPLGVGAHFTAATDQLEPGETVLLYTDGILERPGRTVQEATVELAQAAACVAADQAAQAAQAGEPPVERLPTGILESLIQATGCCDDIALLAARRVPEPGGLHFAVPSDPAALADVRGRLGVWLTDCGVPAHDANALQHAVVELATNSIEHAHPDSAEPATIAVTAVLTRDGRLRAEVADDGKWHASRPGPNRGLGLTMVANLVDAIAFDRGEYGTTAAVTLAPRRPARISTSEDYSLPISRRPADPEPFLVLEQPSAPRPRVRVDGPVDTNTAASLEEQLQIATVAGTCSLTLDLTGVTHLGSAGIDVLHRLTQQHTNHCTDLRLYAPAGSPAHAILALVRLPHTTADPDQAPVSRRLG